MELSECKVNAESCLGKAVSTDGDDIASIDISDKTRLLFLCSN